MLFKDSYKKYDHKHKGVQYIYTVNILVLISCYDYEIL